MKETYEVTCDGSTYVVQLVPRPHRDELVRGCRLYELAADTDLPVPSVVALDDLEAWTYAVVERCPGQPAERNIDPARTRNGGRQLAAIHGLRTFDVAGRLRADAPGDVHPFAVGATAGRLRLDVIDAATPLRAAGLGDAATAVEQVLDAPIPVPDHAPVLCHGDYSPDNLLFHEDTVTAILDFDGAYAGHPHRDLARAATAFWMHDPCADWNVRQRFYDGYTELRPLGGRFGAAEPALRTATLACTVAGLSELGELSSSERAFYAEELVAAADRCRRA